MATRVPAPDRCQLQDRADSVKAVFACTFTRQLDGCGCPAGTDGLDGFWLNLHDQASHGPVGSDVPKLAEFLGYWPKEIVEPDLSPKTYEKYEMFSRLQIIPYLGSKRLDKIQVKDVRQWLNKLAVMCQCCAQGKDTGRNPVTAVKMTKRREPRPRRKRHCRCLSRAWLR